MAADDSSKTEEPTAERKRKARKEGQMARSKDGASILATIAIVLYLSLAYPLIVGALGEFSRWCFGDAYRAGVEPTRAAHRLLGVWATISFPAAIVGALGATAVGLAEAGWKPELELVSFKWERLDPIGKFKQLFNPKETLITTILQLTRVTIVGAVAYNVVMDAMPELLQLSRSEITAGVMVLVRFATRLVVWASGALVVLAALDYLHSWWKLHKQLMMSRQEVKDEMKQQDGDPKVKAQQRARAREMLKRGLAKEVKGSDVIIANPTHVSVAIRYRVKEGAPVVTAKGYDEIALHIREIAKEAGIPIVVNVPLARALARDVKAGRYVPPEFFAAVAEVLAFVYRLRNRRGVA